jgi:hypothetical protein
MIFEAELLAFAAPAFSTELRAAKPENYHNVHNFNGLHPTALVEANEMKNIGEGKEKSGS